MDRLPDVPLLLIFGFIGEHQERAKLERVCKRWQKLLRKDVWKQIRQIKLLKHEAAWIEPIGTRCGQHLVECSFSCVDLDSTLIRSIANNFPALKNLEFGGGQLLNDLDGNAQESFRELGARLRSLNFFAMKNSHRLHHHISADNNFAGLRHLGIGISSQQDMDFLSRSHFANLRSLYFGRHVELGLAEFSACMEQLVTVLQGNLPGLAALYLENNYVGQGQEQQEHFFGQITELKNLRYLRIFFDHFADSELLCACLSNLPTLHALNLNLSIQQLPDVLRSGAFRGLVHLSLPLAIYPYDSYEPIGLLFNFAPQLRSLDLDIMCYQGPSFAFEMLKIAHNDILECLNVEVASITFGELNQLVRQCPNLHFFGAQLPENAQLSKLSELRHVVADQWRAGKRKYLPLKIWLYSGYDFDMPWMDAFLVIRIIPMGISPPNPVLKELLRNEVFNEGGRGTPSFVTSYYR